MRAAVIDSGHVINVILADNPEEFGAVACPDNVGPGWTFDGSNFAPPEKPPRVITQEDVNAEWDRRVFDGFEFMGKVFASDIFSMNDICDHALWARDAMSGGAQAGDYKWHEKEEDFAWKAKDGTYMKMDAPTMVLLHVGMTMHKQAHFIAAQAIKAMTPIPDNYKDDTYWP